MADEIVKAPDANNDPEWTEIVEKLIEEMGDELPDKVIEATELLVSGWSTHQAAKKLGTSAKTVRAWLEKYPAMAMAVRDGRQLLRNGACPNLNNSSSWLLKNPGKSLSRPDQQGYQCPSCRCGRSTCPLRDVHVHGAEGGC